MIRLRTGLPASVLVVGMFVSIPAWAQRNAPDADAEYSQGRYAVALAQFERRAAEGDAAAAEMAGQMHYYGATVYGTGIAQDLRRARSLLTQAAESGRPMANYLIRQLERAALASGVEGSEAYVPGPHGC